MLKTTIVAETTRVHTVLGQVPFCNMLICNKQIVCACKVMNNCRSIVPTQDLCHCATPFQSEFPDMPGVFLAIKPPETVFYIKTGFLS